MPLVFDNAKKIIGEATVDWPAGDVRTLLVGPGYSPDAENHANVSDVTGELSGGTYARQVIGGRLVQVVGGIAEFVADATTWASLSTPGNQSAAGAVVFLQGAGDTTSPLLAFVDFTPTLTNGGDLVVRWAGGASAGAVFRIA